MALDKAALLRPVPGDDPGGEDLRSDYSHTAPYQKLRQAVQAARDAERKQAQGAGDGGILPAPPDWTPVLDYAPKLLAEKSKDLEVCAWLIEALVRADGFAGLRDGLELGVDLVRNFWPQLHPRRDDDGFATRLATLSGVLQHTLEAPIVSVPITEGADAAGGYGEKYFRLAESLSQLDEAAAAERVAKGAVSRAMIDSALADTSVAFHRRIAEDLTACLEALQELESALREQCEADLQSRVAAAESRMAGAKKAARDEIDRELTRLRAEAQELDDSLPSTRRTREALDACLSRVQSALGEKEHDHVVEIPNAGEVTVVRPVSEPRTSDPDIASREHALQELLRIARFFETTEPTNPIRYVLERAVRWARMPLPALYDELITDKSERAKLFRLVGISRNDEPEE